METKKLPNGFEIPVLGIGTCLMGGEDYGPPEYSNDKMYINAIQEAIKLGYTHIDTAEIYGGNHTEELVGIFKSTSTTHLKENKDIFDFKLTDEEIQKIDALVPSL